MSTWTEVSKKQPCPACGGTDWCAWAPDGNLRCMRQGETPEGFFRVCQSDREGAVIFRRCRAPVNQQSAFKTTEASRESVPSYEQRAALALLQGEFEEQMDDGKLSQLAESLGVTADSLEKLTVGWATREQILPQAAWGKRWNEEDFHGVYTFPEFDHTQALCGFSLRTPAGRKGALGRQSGARRGLIIPEDAHIDRQDRQGRCLVVEGVSDVAACLTRGIHAIGRPSNCMGAETVAALYPNRSLLVIGENDLKPDGRHPGLIGALRVSSEISRRLGRPIGYCLPPNDFKDMRAWLASGISATDVWAYLEAACPFHMEGCNVK